MKLTPNSKRKRTDEASQEEREEPKRKKFKAAELLLNNNSSLTTEALQNNFNVETIEKPSQNALLPHPETNPIENMPLSMENATSEELRPITNNPPHSPVSNNNQHHFQFFIPESRKAVKCDEAFFQLTRIDQQSNAQVKVNPIIPKAIRPPINSNPSFSPVAGNAPYGYKFFGYLYENG